MKTQGDKNAPKDKSNQDKDPKAILDADNLTKGAQRGKVVPE